MKKNNESKTATEMLEDRLQRLANSKGKTVDHIKRVKRRMKVLNILKDANEFWDCEKDIEYFSEHRV